VVQIADAYISAWENIDAALCPILGHLGVAALYKRSLFLASSTHSWLGGTHEDASATIDFGALRALLTLQSSANAVAGGHAHLQTFYDLLAGLIGPSLTERLLSSVWAIPSGGPPQDTPL
jgi:hypothetical protein